ncbi:MAG: hypothetical protein GY702_01930 [Desulfobulbaceae bacterium]|nr:hypothetical protein [Desulfobulbaceae bacterium]
MDLTIKVLVLLIFLCLMVSGCTRFADRSSNVILQNPETMDFVNCKVDKWNSKKSYEANDKCVEDYKKQGYIIWGEL